MYKCMPCVITSIGVAMSRCYNMTICIAVGQTEIHKIVYEFQNFFDSIIYLEETVINNFLTYYMVI